jgi:hypothetical protein
MTTIVSARCLGALALASLVSAACGSDSRPFGGGSADAGGGEAGAPATGGGAATGGGTATGGAAGTSSGGSGGTPADGGGATGGSGGNTGGFGGLTPCGNGQLDDGETCDGDCPTSCVDPDLCTRNVLTGAPETCNVACSFTPIVVCQPNDGCCPSGCAKSNDFDCQPDVMVIGADQTTHLTAVANALTGTGLFGVVSTFNAQNAAVPTADALRGIEAVLVLVFGGLVDPAPLGNTLADYHDAGGKVVLTNGANCHQTYRLRGRFDTGGYHVLEEGGVYPDPDSIGSVLVPNSPLIAGVNAVSLSSVHCATDAVDGAEVIASYATTGSPAVVLGQVAGRNRVDVNLYIGSGGDLATPGVLTLITNALRYPAAP